jgi:uncharacterized protein
MSAPELDVIWDAAKAQSNLAKHSVSFAQAATVLADPLALSVYDAAHRETEERWFTLGVSSDGKLLAVAHTYLQTEPNHVQVRMISAREATRHEREQYANEPR